MAKSAKLKFKVLRAFKFSKEEPAFKVGSFIELAVDEMSDKLVADGFVEKVIVDQSKEIASLKEQVEKLTASSGEVAEEMSKVIIDKDKEIASLKEQVEKLTAEVKKLKKSE